MSAKSFWNRVKSLIKNKKVTQEMTARVCRIPLNTWRGWNSKNIVPGVEDCIKIAKYLNVSLDFLIKGKEHDSHAEVAEIRSLLEKANDKLNALR